nr:NAD(P)/FAD-dependent oxidoreductase [uncultured Mediterraneibacter sp.]
MYDVIIIGAGVSGSAVARELSRYQLKVCVLERKEDVCAGTSKANSGIVHAGFDAEPGSLMARLNVRGNRMMEQLSEELDFPFQRNGSLVVCTDEDDVPRLEELKKRGEINGVSGLEILNRSELAKIEPNISDRACAALYAPSGGIVCPFGLNIALAENACENGVEFYFNTEVTSLEKEDSVWKIYTNSGIFSGTYVVNAAGVYADVFHNMVSSRKIHIAPRRGEYCLLDHTAGNHVSHTIFALPGKYGKGVLVTPTVHANLLIGPTAADIDDKEGTCTTGDGLEQVIQKASLNVRDIPVGKIITSFAGLRAHEDGHEFIIGEPDDAPKFIDCAGIESPGLTSCPAIGEMASQVILKRMNPARKPDFISTRKGILNPSLLSEEEHARLVKKNPAYGNIICRCEQISEGEILDAIHRPLGAKSLDGIKRRTRAGMGRCQAGFCSPKVMGILSRELHVDMSEITKSGGSSKIIWDN